MNKENQFIQYFKSKFNGDDGAVVGKWVYSTDSFFENVHFKRKWLTLKQIGAKAMLVNISDAIAMNAKPKYALLNVAMPTSITPKELEELASGFTQIAKQFDIEIIGGDTIANTKLDISVTIISKTTDPLLRSGMQYGDFIAFCGSLGTSKKDLDKLLIGEKIEETSKFIAPKLYPKFISEVRKYLHCGMDISDGLFFELERLSRINNLGIEFLRDISVDEGCSGEEYEILFSFSPKNLKKINAIAQKHNIQINICAKATKGKLFSCPCKPHHF